MKTLHEYIREIEINLNIPAASNAKLLKKIKPRDWSESTLTVYFKENETECLYIVVDSRFGVSDPIGFLGFEKVGDKMLCARNAAVKPNFQKRGILSELMLFVKKTTGFEIISDTIMSDAGIALWKSLSRSPFFSMKIVDVKNNIKFDFSDIGSELPDGDIAIDPKDDNKNEKFYEVGNPNGQRFFYILESADKFNMMVETTSYAYGYLMRSREPHGLLSPHGYFETGDL